MYSVNNMEKYVWNWFFSKKKILNTFFPPKLWNYLKPKMKVCYINDTFMT